MFFVVSNVFLILYIGGLGGTHDPWGGGEEFPMPLPDRLVMTLLIRAAACVVRETTPIIPAITMRFQVSDWYSVKDLLRSCDKDFFTWFELVTESL